MAKEILGSWESDDFLESNPFFRGTRLSDDVNALYGESHASKILWALTAYYHPSSPYSEMTHHEKISEINRTILKGKSTLDLFDSNDASRIRDLFQDIIIGKARRRFNVWDKKMDELTFEVDALDLRLEDHRKEFKDLSKALPAMYEALDKVKAMVAEEDMRNKKGGDEGASDEGQLFDE